MFDEPTVSVVNNLLAREQCSLLQRYAESEVHLTGESMTIHETLLAMVAEERTHVRKLADLIDRLHATPGPRRVDALTGQMHFNEPQVLVPLLVADKKRLLAAYESAAPRVAQSAEAVDVVAAIAGQHRSHVARLEGLLHSAAN